MLAGVGVEVESRINGHAEKLKANCERQSRDPAVLVCRTGHAAANAC